MIQQGKNVRRNYKWSVVNQTPDKHVTFNNKTSPWFSLKNLMVEDNCEKPTPKGDWLL